jgi:hypothetical protein
VLEEPWYYDEVGGEEKEAAGISCETHPYGNKYEYQAA